MQHSILRLMVCAAALLLASGLTGCHGEKKLMSLKPKSPSQNGWLKPGGQMAKSPWPGLHGKSSGVAEKKSVDHAPKTASRRTEKGSFAHMVGGKKVPTRVLLVASAAPLEGNGAQVANGVLCRVYFFHEEDPVPVEAQGQLAFTLYDRSHTDPNNPARSPDGRYEIDGDRLAQHFRKDLLGPSYVFWLPYDPLSKTQVVVQGTFAPATGKSPKSPQDEPKLLASEVATVEIKPLHESGSDAVAQVTRTAQPAVQLAAASRAAQANAGSGVTPLPPAVRP